MTKKTDKLLKVIIFTFLINIIFTATSYASNATTIEIDTNAGLQKLYNSSQTAKDMSTIAKGILIFPNVVKAGFMFGGQYGEGALKVNGRTQGYYNTVAGSFGLQIGAQSFGFAMFFMTDSSLKYLEESEGWEIGVGPSVTIVDEGISKSLTTTTAKDDIYVFFYGQQGLMAGLGIQGSKITPINPQR